MYTSSIGGRTSAISDIGRGAIANKIRSIDEDGRLIETIQSHLAEQQRNFENKIPFNNGSVRNQLEDVLKQVEKTIGILGRICLTKMLVTNDKLTQIEVNLSQVDGSLQAIRANAGRKLITPPQPSTNFKGQDDLFLPRTVQFPIQFPDYQLWLVQFCLLFR